MLGQELPALIRDGYTSFKVYMTYDLLRLDDGQMLDILAVARREGALVMVHAENHDMIKWLTGRLLERGLGAPRYHAVSHARIAEGEATNRAIALSELVDVPILIVHVSAAEAIEEIRDAQTKGLKIYGETCPQYLFLTADDIGSRSWRARNSAAARRRATRPRRRRCGAASRNGTFQVFSSDHAPYRFDETGKLPEGRQDDLQGDRQRRARHRTARAAAVFRRGRQGPDRPQPLCRADRDQPRQALRPVSAQGHDRGRQRRRHRDLGPRARRSTVTAGMLHDNVGYTPYEGCSCSGWPVTVLSAAAASSSRTASSPPSAAAAISCPALCPMPPGRSAAPTPELAFAAATGGQPLV